MFKIVVKTFYAFLILLIVLFSVSCSKESTIENGFLGIGAPSGSTSNIVSTSPTISISSPLTNSYINSATDSATFSILGTCNLASRAITIFVDSVTVTTTGASCDGTNFNVTIDTTSLSAGSHTVTAQITNASGTTATSAGITITRDVTAPTVAITTPANNSYINSSSDSSTFTVSGTCTELGTVTIKVDGTSVTTTGGTCDGTNFSATINTTSLTEASHSFTAVNTDPAGNATTSAAKTVIRDVTAPSTPTIALQSPATSPGTDTTPTFRVSGVANGLSVAIYTSNTCAVPSLKGSGTATGATIDIDSSALTDNTYTFYANATDAAGNISNCSSSASSSAAYETDTTAPTLASVVVLNRTPTNNRSYYLSYGTITGTYSHYCILNNDTTVGNCTWTSGTVPNYYIQTPTNAANTLSVWLKDAAGNVSTRVNTNTVTFARKDLKSSSYGYATCQLFEAGNVKCWGMGSNGELGNYSLSNAINPTPVRKSTNTADIADVTAIARGYMHTCLLLEDKTVQCMGLNTNGQLGDGTTSYSTLPVQVKDSAGTGILSNVVAITAGYNYSCALLSNQTVQCWGYNVSGYLGNGTWTSSSLPVQVKNLSGTGSLSNVIQITSSYSHSCALLSDRTAQCWGENGAGTGTLGNGTTTNSNLPVQVLNSNGVGSLSNLYDISAGYGHTCAVLENGNVKCWGVNNNGQLGVNNNAISNSTLPVTVVDNAGTGTLTEVYRVYAGAQNTCTIGVGSYDQRVRCWGSNQNGSLGIGNLTTPYLTPQTMLDTNGTTAVTGIIAVAPLNTNSNLSTCVLKENETAYCTGYDESNYGTLGSSATSSSTLIAVDYTITTPTLTSLAINGGDTVTSDSTPSFDSISRHGTAYSRYCILQNDTKINHCTWTVGLFTAMPAFSGYGTITYSIWLKNESGGISSRLDTTPITYEWQYPALRYSGSEKYWMRYVAKANTNHACELDPTDIQSNYTYINDCIFAGDKRVVNVKPAITTTCGNFTMSDNLGAFDWTCDDSSGSVVFYSKLKETKHLSDLIDFANAQFYNNYITLDSNAGQTWSGTNSKWFKDNFNVLPANTGNLETISNSTININPVNQNVLGIGLSIPSTQSAIVIQPGYFYMPSTSLANPVQSCASGRSLICLNQSSQIWIEGSFKAINTNTADYGILDQNSALLKLDNVKIVDTNMNGINLINTFMSVLKNIRIANSTKSGLSISDARYISVYDSHFNNNTENGIVIDNSNNIYLENIISTSNYRSGLQISDSHNNVINRSTFSFNGEGIEEKSTSSSKHGENLYKNLILNSNNTYGLNSASQDYSMNYSYLLQLVSQGHTHKDFSASSNMQMDKINSYSTIDGVFDHGTDYSNQSTSKSVFAYGVATDTLNLDGNTIKLFTQITDWFNFENLYRGWNENVNPNSNPYFCTTGDTCEIWDYSISSTDTNILNKSQNLNTANGAFIHKANCPAEARLSTNYSYSDSNGTYTIGLNLVELMDYDENGNFNGLCESGETCLYTPNIGAYQGHGNLIYCNDGATKIYGYDTNGR